jgi:SOUL heme-binding protein
LPAPIGEEVKIREVEGDIAAVKKFSGRPTEEVVKSKEKDLRSALIKDGLKPKKGCLLARYNDQRTSVFVMVLFIFVLTLSLLSIRVSIYIYIYLISVHFCDYRGMKC